MKNTLHHLLVALLLAGATTFLHAPAGAQTPAEDIGVSVSLNQGAYLPGEPVTVNLTLHNSGPDLYVRKGFKETDFYLLLRFTAPDGAEILTHATEVDGQHTPPPPRVHYLGTVPLQVVPLEVVENGWTGGSEPFDAREWYDFLVGGDYSVRAEISLRTYPGIDHTISGDPFANLVPVAWEGTLVSNDAFFTFLTDGDGDGHLYPGADCDDGDPSVPGPVEIPGNGKDDDCDPATPDAVATPAGMISLQADRHTVGGGSHPGSTKTPIEGMNINAYDMNSNCVQALGVSWQNYPSIWLSCTFVATAATDAAGEAGLSLPPGDYIVIGEDPLDGEDVFVGRSAGDLESGAVMKKYLQIIVKADKKKVPGRYKVKTGSLLLIIEPEYVEWDGTEELYPFIFDSVGDWTVTTSVAPPEGFVADSEALTEEVNTEVEAVQFTITDVGSEWVSTGVVHEVKHKGKTEKIKSRIGVKLSKKLAKQKGLGRYGGKEKKEKKEKK